MADDADNGCVGGVGGDVGDAGVSGLGGDEGVVLHFSTMTKHAWGALPDCAEVGGYADKGRCGRVGLQ
jgi:hypothetical protein